MMKLKTVQKDGVKFSFINEEEFEQLYQALFINREYPFETKNKSPFILDCGSHIGLSILYFKKLYPNAKVIGFEPNPLTFEILKINISQNSLKNVEIFNAALSDKEGEIDFYICNHDDAWRTGNSAVLNAYIEGRSQTIKVKSKKLSSVITNPIDLIKIDIEGMEEKVLEEIEEKMFLVKEIQMEFHGDSRIEQVNNIDRIISLFKKNNFRYDIFQDGEIVKENEISRLDPYSLGIYAIKYS